MSAYVTHLHLYSGYTVKGEGKTKSISSAPMKAWEFLKRVCWGEGRQHDEILA